MATETRPMTDAAEMIRDARARMGLTQAEFAEQLSVTPLTVHRWESGQSRPRRLALERLQSLHGRGGEELHATAVAVRSTQPHLDFAGDPSALLLVAEAYRLAHGHQFNPTFASETSRIDPLPHQRIAVYERMLPQDPLRFLLADDAGAGKTIMTGLYIREMLSRRRIRRFLIVPPAGLVGNWERELRTLFRLQCRIVSGSDVRRGHPFVGSDGEAVIVSLDTLATDGVFAALCEPAVEPYDLVVFDEAHKLSASRTGRRVDKTRRYALAEALAGVPGRLPAFQGLAWATRHLLLLTATPHMGRESPYHHLWRLLDPQVFEAAEALRRFPVDARQRHFIRRTKEEMVDLDGNPLYRPRMCATFSYDLTPGEDGEQALYDRTTAYLREHYDRALGNRPAVELAMSVFQRRLASSTLALLRSLERRIEKLEGMIDDLRAGTVSGTELRRRQGRLDRDHRDDYFDRHGADEDAREEGVGERNEDYEHAVLGAVTALTVEGLRDEVGSLEDLRERARRLVNAGDESKFEKLREVLEDPGFADGASVARLPKWLIFSEHRDTVDFLVRRIEALGYVDQVAVVHGGMPWPEREEQVERFRQRDGARFLIATDAAGEGINLQFCHLMVNYDIPWNPARLEQRMGRIHRYGQKHDVRIVNLVAGSTREGHVLTVLLDKLEAIRQELHSDKVFDVIGRLLSNESLRHYMIKAVTGDPVDQAKRLERTATNSRAQEVMRREAEFYGLTGDVAPRLDALRRDLERERYVQLLPAYVRRFVESATSRLGIAIRGDLEQVFSLLPTAHGSLDPLLSALEGYPPSSRSRFRIRRPRDDDGCIWLRPGEPVFDALAAHVISKFSRDAERGAIFVDPRADAPYLAHLARVEVVRDPSPTSSGSSAVEMRRETLDGRLITVGQDERGSLAEQPLDALLLLRGARHVAPGAVPLASRAWGMRTDAIDYLRGHLLQRLVDLSRDAERAEQPERRRRLMVSYDLLSAELAQRRAALRRDTTIDAEELASLKREQQTLAARRQKAMDELERTPERVGPGTIRLLAHALVLPPTGDGEVERHDARVEEVAVRIASSWEMDRGATVQDVSTPELARQAGLPDWPGFDLLSRAQDNVRSIEVKGRADRGAIQMEGNEWKQAMNLGDRYWLYVVYDCATPQPRLYRVRDPFATLLATERTASTFVLNVGTIVTAAESG